MRKDVALTFEDEAGVDLIRKYFPVHNSKTNMDKSRLTLAICFCFFTVLVQPTISRLTPGQNGLELYFLADRSSSISEISLNKAKKLMVQIIKVFNISSEPNGGKGGTRAAVITYAETAEVLFDLDDPNIRSVEAFEQKLSEIQALGGGTNIMTALLTIRSIRMKRKVRNETNKAIFLITDGKSTEGGDILEQLAGRIKNGASITFIQPPALSNNNQQLEMTETCMKIYVDNRLSEQLQLLQ